MPVPIQCSASARTSDDTWSWAKQEVGWVAAVLGPYRRWWVIGFGWVVLAVLAFVRPSWLILFPLWAIATTRSSSRRIIAATVVASIVIGTAILFATTSAAFGRRAFLTDLLIGAAIAVFVYLLFGKLLTLSLPAGPLEHLL